MFLFVSTEVSAAEIRKVIPPDSPSLSSIVIEGLIEPGDFLKFKQALTSEPFLDKVTLWSPGGDALEAIKIGRLIRKLRMRTEAPLVWRLKDGNNVWCKLMGTTEKLDQENPNCSCLSSCFLIYTAGIERYGNYLGVHRPHIPPERLLTLSDDKVEKGMKAAEQLVRDYLIEMDTPRDIIDIMMKTNSQEIYFLTKAQEEEIQQEVPFVEELILSNCKEMSIEDRKKWRFYQNRNNQADTKKRDWQILSKKWTKQIHCGVDVKRDINERAYSDWINKEKKINSKNSILEELDRLATKNSEQSKPVSKEQLRDSMFDSITKLDVEGTKKVLEAGANPNDKYLGTGASALYYTSIRVSASRWETKFSKYDREDRVLQIFKLLLEYGAKIGPKDDGLLAYPARYGFVRLGKYLIDAGVDPNATWHGSGETPMSVAVKFKQYKFKTMLLANGVESIGQKEAIQIELIQAVEEGQIQEVTNLLLDGADINGKDSQGECPLHVAVYRGNLRMVKLLLMSGANPSIEASYGSVPASPLWIEGEKSAAGGKSILGNYNHKIFMLLLEAGADVTLTNVLGQTPLHVCAQRGNLPCVKALLDSGAKVISANIEEAKGKEVIRLLKEAVSMN